MKCLIKQKKGVILYMKNDKWVFLNLKEQNYEEKDKVDVAREVNAIEYLANEFRSKGIVSQGSDNVLDIRDEVMSDINLQNKYEIAKLKRKISPGTLAIKQRLGINK